MQKEFSHLLRQAYINALSILELNGVNIPVSGEYANYTPAELTVGNMPVFAYVLVKNQTEDDNSPKYQFNSTASIQLHIVCKYPANWGDSVQAELISNEILQILFPAPSITTLTLTDFNIWKSKKESSRVVVDETDRHRVFTKIIIISHEVQQRDEAPEPPTENIGFDYSFDFSLS